MPHRLVFRLTSESPLRLFCVRVCVRVCVCGRSTSSLSGLIGGMTDALQSFVLPPLIYFLESSRSAATAASTAKPPPKPPKSPQYSAINTHEQTLEGLRGGGHFNRQSFCSLLALHTCRGSGVSWRQRLELWGCLFLSLFGAVYIVLTTTNNVKTIIEFVHSK
mmetsp:Transcript_45878/g.90503  ORF Transcript_45878/g.90503 Transcript_45878/m.90503 type:complete len:163 (+) Transcript_45878:651-1139(+)